MAAGRWRTRFRLGAVLFAIFIQVINGYEDIYTISQLSPKSISADEFLVEEVLETSRTPHLEFNIEPSIYMPDEDEEHDKIDIDDNEEENEHVIVARSADPMRDRQSRSINIDEIVSSQNNDIDNDIELHNKRKYYEIHPTKSLDYLRDRDDVILSSEGFGDKLDFRFPGEGQRVPRGRALPPQGPKIHPTIVQPMFATATHRDQARQNSAEIQNIITGIVKLLNGNVNVQANSQLLNGRPERPTASRINNRGPPRISEAPLPPYPLEYEKPISAFEKPMHSFVPTKSPPPYPFDRPPHVGINLPEQIVPPIGPNPYRPGFHRPNRPPPWHRPRPRPNPNKRPSPNLPSYKPSVSTLHQNILPVDLPEETEDILTISENESNHSENNIHSDDKEIIPITSLDETTPEAEIVKEDDSKQTTVTNEVESKLETLSNTTTTSSSTTSTSTTTTTENVIETTKEEPTTTTEKITEKTTTSTTTEKIKEKPIKQEKDTNKKKESGNEKERQKDKYKIVEDKIVNKPKNETVTEQMIEPSIVDKPVTASIAPTPTEGLPPYTPEIIHYTNSSSIVKTSINSQPLPTPQAIPYEPYRPRPGIVLDDPDFKPKGTRHRPDAAVITATETNLPPGYGETFVVTVSAIQGPGEGGGASVHIENIPLLGEIAHGDHDIIVSPSGDQGFVSINGEKSYINIFGDDSSTVADIKPTAVHRPPPKSAPPPHIGTGIAIPADDLLPQPAKRPPQVQQRPASRPPTPSGYRKPQPTVRIDTCIVGDDSTCDRAQNEKCRTEVGISSCQCRPGYARRNHRDPCRRVVSLVLNVRVDKLYDRTVAWNVKLADKESEQYQKLSYEALRAIDSAFSMTRFSDDFVGGVVNSVHNGDQYYQGVYVNYTILMQESPETLRTAISTEIESQLLGVIRRRRNNIGQSALYVDTPHASVVPPSDLDECSTPDLNDCHKLATCTNTWGGFRCACSDGTRDAFPGELYQSGRECQSCANSHCNDRGTCRYANNQPYCSCSSGYYGSTCEVDGEVVGVAVGASLAAALVIALTLAALMSWSRKWSREQKAAGMGSPVFNYMAANTIKTPPVGQPPYQVTLEERMRWAQIAEAMAANHYAQAESAQAMATRPSSAMFGGYPTLPPVPMPRMGIMSGHHTGTLNTVASRANTAASHHNMYGYINHAATESTSSEASSHVQERADLLVPRPKSRARSMHNQTGIYYDVDYENAPEAIYGTKGIPLSTYTVSRGPPFYRT